MSREMFKRIKEYTDMVDLLEGWTDDPGKAKVAFMSLMERLSGKEGASLAFISRPGISYSLRGDIDSPGDQYSYLFAMVDIIDDDPKDRWLSVCFYGDMITDPDDEGDLVPGGLLGQDGYCFDLYDCDESAIRYLEQRIDEAYANTLSR